MRARGELIWNLPRRMESHPSVSHELGIQAETERLIDRPGQATLQSNLSGG